MGKTYISPSGTAKESEKIYIGDENNLAKEIKRAYIGDSNGVARMVFGPPYPPPVVTPLYLIKDGKSVNTEVTGGWQGRASALDLSGSARIPSIMQFPYSSNKYGRLGQGSGDGANSGIYETINNIDLTYYNKLVLDGYRNSNTYSIYGYLCVITRPNTVIKKINIVSGSNIRTNNTMDISNITGNYDICLLAKCHNSATSLIYVYNLWLET